MSELSLAGKSDQTGQKELSGGMMYSTESNEAMEQFTLLRSLKRTRLLGWVGAVVFAGAALVSTAYGQAYLGTVNGTVTDQTGAAIVGAQVQVIDENTHFISPATTNNAGLYTVPYLMPGTYDVKVQAAGFSKAVQTGAVLVATDIKEVNFKLSPASTSANVTVIADQQLIDTESASVQTVLTSNILQNSPVIDANPIMMATRVAGVYSNFTQNTETTQWYPQGGGISGTSVGGGGNAFFLNGIDELPSRGAPGQYTGYVPSSLALQEMNVQTAPFDASIGHTAVGMENVVLKTGTAEFHGEAQFQYGDRIFNSNFSNRTALGQSRPSDTWSMPGFVVTGPVIIPKLLHRANAKTFFMAQWEHFQYNIATYIGVSQSVPTVKERGGDFSELSAAGTAAGLPLEGTIYDPTTTVPTGAPTTYASWCAGLPGGCTAGMRESFTQEYNEGPSNPSLCNGDTNCIPTSRFNPAAVAFLQYYPQPTSVNPTSPANGNYSPKDISAPDSEWVGAFEIDQEFNPNNKVKATFLPYIAHDLGKGYDFPIINGYSGGGYDDQYQKEWGGLLDYTKIISPTMVLDLRVGGTYSPFTQEHASANMPLSLFNMTGATTTFPYPNFPGISPTGPFVSYTGLNSGASNFWYGSLADGHAEVSKSFQKHNVKTGMEYLLARDDYQNPESAVGTFNFDTMFTNSNASNTTTTTTNGVTTYSTPAKYGGDGIASLLLGYPTSGTATINPGPNVQWDYWAAFVQDDWRITPRLTLNMGLRWEYYSPYTERHNGLEAGFDFSSTQPFNLPNATGTGIASSNAPPASAAVPQGYTGGLYFVGTPSHPGRNYVDKCFGCGWEPRFGASWLLNRNTVLRGGYAVFLNPLYPGVNNNGFTSPTSFVASTNSAYTPATCSAAQNADAYGFCNLTNPYPNGYVQPTGNLLGLSTGLGGNISVAGPQYEPGVDQVWTVGLERQLPLNMMVDVEYHANRTTRTGVSKNWNTLPECYYYGGGCPNAGNATALAATVANPMSGYLPCTSALNAGAHDCSTRHAAGIPQSDLDVPYPEFGSITQSLTNVPGTNSPIGWGLNNALYVTFVKRTSYGLEFHMAFTYAKIEDTTLLNAGDAVTNLYKTEDGSPDRFFTGDIVYNTPKLNVNRALGYIVNNWQWSHALNWQAGAGLGLPGSTFPGTGAEATTHQTLAHWFNTCYIPILNNGNVGQTLNGVVNQSPVYGTPTNCQNGEQPAWIQQPTQTLNRYAGTIRNVRLNEIPYYDMALAKTVPVHENYTLTIRAEAHNVFNDALLGQTGPTETLTSATYGQFPLAGTAPNGNPVYGQANDPRIVRFDVRFSF
jgi:Carboxypeptidase regulatory-like domain